MNNFTISVFGNKIFSEIICEIKSFSKYQIKYYDDLDLCINDGEKENHVAVFFINKLNKVFFNKIKKINFPLIKIYESDTTDKKLLRESKEQLNMPFSINVFEKKIISLIAKSKFKKNSLINLNGYVIDKNERKIKKNNLELQLSEKEIDFLILFSENKDPIKRELVLKKVWNYSKETETHTVETHIHRLRKKILDKFNDNNFIKNNKKGYYI